MLLLAYDGSDNAADAIRAAGVLFPGAEATVVVVRGLTIVQAHGSLARLALPDGVIGETAETFEREADERAQGVADKGAELARGAGLDAHGAIRVDTSAWRAIAATALELSASAVVCGSRGNGAMSRAVLGSTSTSLLHHAGCPLLVVPAGPGPLDGPALIGYDGTDGAKAVLPVAAALLGDRAAVITHVWTSPLESFGGASLEVTPTTFGETALELEQQVRLMADDVALEGAELARAAGMPARPLTVQARGGAWRSLLEAAGEQGAAVLVTGNRGRGAMKSSVLGSVSAGLAHNAELPVLIVRG